MKTLLVIHPHSFVDVITNSSSELFVIKDKKSANIVIDAIEDLLKINNKTNEDKTTYKEAIGSVKTVMTEEEAIEIFVKYNFYMLNNFSALEQLMRNPEYKHYEDDEIRSMVKEGKVDYKKYVKVGDIVVLSKDDNSIPYEVIQAIEGMFNCERYHLG